MKKRSLIILLATACAAVGALGLSACNFGGGHSHNYDTEWSKDGTHHWHECIGSGECDAKEKDKAEHVDGNRDGRCDICDYEPMIIPQDAPVEIKYTVGATQITVENAFYGEDKTTSFDTEYRLDDGEWKKRSRDEGYLQFTGLQPASEHTLYARMSAKEGYSASEAYSVTVKTIKAANNKSPEESEVSFEINGRTAVFTLNEGIELSVDNANTFSAERVINHTFSKVGENYFYIRYAATETHGAGPYIRMSVFATDFAGGDGTEDKPYLIGTPEQFAALKNFWRSGYHYFALTADIACSDEVYENNGMSGVYFDGRGHKITGLKQKEPLFYSVRVVKNLIIEGAEYRTKIRDEGEESITSPAIIASLLNYAENVSVSGSITVLAPNNNVSFNYDYGLAVGGICATLAQRVDGEAYGMSRCNAAITVSLPNLKEKAGQHLELDMGGLAGMNPHTDWSASDDFAVISRCSAELNVTSAFVSNAHIGGLVGGEVKWNGRYYGPTAHIRDCFTTGSVNINFFAKDNNSHSGKLRMGGIVPEITGIISSCYSSIDFNVNTELDSSYSASVYIGGICANAHYEQDFAYQRLDCCLFAGSISVVNSAVGAGTKFHLDAVCTDKRGFSDSSSGWYYKEGSNSSAAGGETVNAEGSQSVSESEMLTANWQKEALNFSDENYWNIEDGKLPTLK